MTTVAVTFNVAAATAFGESFYVAGSVAELGRWDTGKAVELSAADYTEVYPRWYATVALAVGERVEYKYFRRGGDGVVSYEGGGNRVVDVPGPGGCEGEGGVHDVLN